MSGSRKACRPVTTWYSARVHVQSMTSPAEIEALIRADLRDARVDIQDTIGDGDHFHAVVVSSAFAGKPLVERHQLVYRSLKGAMADRIHALSLRTYTPEEFERVR